MLLREEWTACLRCAPSLVLPPSFARVQFASRAELYNMNVIRSFSTRVLLSQATREDFAVRSLGLRLRSPGFTQLICLGLFSWVMLYVREDLAVSQLIRLAAPRWLVPLDVVT